MKAGVSSENGDQILQCKYCGTRRMADYRRKFKLDSEKQCPNCKSMIIRKDGKTSNNEQRYKCKICNTRFVEHSMYGKINRIDLTQEEKKVIYYYGLILKLPIKDIASHLHRGRSTIYSYIKELKEKHANK